MAGFLDTFFGNRDQTAALGLLGAQMMGGNMPQGLLSANQYLAGSQDREAERQMRQLQVQEAQQRMDDLARQRGFLSNLPAPGASVPPLLYEAAKAGVVSLPDYLKATMPKQMEYGKIDPKDYTPESLREAAATGDYSKLVAVRENKIAPNGQVYNPFQIQPGQNFVDPNKPFAIGPNNTFVPNTPYQNYELAKSRAGATNVNVNTDKSYFGNVAEGLAKNDVALIDAARSAPDRIASSRRVIDLLDKNPITGTGAESRLSLNKALATAGLIDGTNVANTEMLASTLASQTLDAIKTSGLGSGQGFTDKDRQFLERAKSGNIEMNPQALRRIAELNEMSARQTIQRGNAVIQKLRSSPQSGAVGQQLDPIQEPASSQPPRQMFDSKPVANMANKGKVLTDTATGQKWRSNGFSWVEEK